MRDPTVNYEIAITLCFQLCSASYTTLLPKNSMRNASTINPVTRENTDNNVGKPPLATTTQHLVLSANGTQR